METATTSVPKRKEKAKSPYQQIMEAGFKKGIREASAEDRQEVLNALIKEIMLAQYRSRDVPRVTDMDIALVFNLPSERMKNLRAEFKREQAQIRQDKALLKTQKEQAQTQ